MSDRRKSLVRLRDEAARAATQRLLEDPDSDAGALLRRVDAAERLLAHLTPQPRAKYVAAAIALMCVAVAGLAWALPLPRTAITATIVTEAVALHLSDPWNWTGAVSIGRGPVRIDGWNEVSAPMLGVNVASRNGDAWLETESGEMRLLAMGLGAGGRISLLRRDDAVVDVLALRAPFEADLAIEGRTRVRAGNGTGAVAVERELQSPVPETVEMRSRGESIVPARLTVGGEPWSLTGLRVNEMSLARQIAADPGSVSFESAVLNGKLVISATGTVHDIARGERLTLRGLRGQIREMAIKDAIEIRFEGAAADILVGSGELTRSLAPSVLAYLYHYRPLSFFWSAILFLWGFLWSAHRLAAG